MTLAECCIWRKNLCDAYHGTLFALAKEGKIYDCPDWNCKQLEVSMTMVVDEPLQEPMISKFFIGGPRELQQYVMEMLDGILDFEVDKGKWHYTYHQRYSDQLDYVINELKRNPFSRRAVMVLWDKEKDTVSGEPPCLNHIQFFIRDGKLHMKVLFRSNDAVKATFMNAFALIMLQKKVAEILGVEVGSYTHKANSFHCYEKDFEKLSAFIRNYRDVKVWSDHQGIPFEYNYEGDWKEEMEDCIPEILESVKILKER